MSKKVEAAVHAALVRDLVRMALLVGRSRPRAILPAEEPLRKTHPKYRLPSHQALGVSSNKVSNIDFSRLRPTRLRTTFLHRIYRTSSTEATTKGQILTSEKRLTSRRVSAGRREAGIELDEELGEEVRLAMDMPSVSRGDQPVQ